MKKLFWKAALPLTIIPMIAISSCSSTPSEINDLLNDLQDTLAKQTYNSESKAKEEARISAASIVNNANNIPGNIVNASIFSNYPWNQIPGDNLVTQLEPLAANWEGTKVFLTVRIAYSYNNDLNKKHYSDSKKLTVEFYVSAK